MRKLILLNAFIVGMSTFFTAHATDTETTDSFICERIMNTAYRYTCAQAGARDSADCYVNSKGGYYDQDEYDIYWKATCRRRGERKDICSLTSLPQDTCERADCQGMRPEWTYSIGDRDGDPCP